MMTIYFYQFNQENIKWLYTYTNIFNPTSHYTQKLIWDGLDINAKTETIRLLEENLGEYHHDLYQAKIFQIGPKH